MRSALGYHLIRGNVRRHCADLLYRGATGESGARQEAGGERAHLRAARHGDLRRHGRVLRQQVLLRLLASGDGDPPGSDQRQPRNRCGRALALFVFTPPFPSYPSGHAAFGGAARHGACSRVCLAPTGMRSPSQTHSCRTSCCTTRIGSRSLTISTTRASTAAYTTASTRRKARARGVRSGATCCGISYGWWLSTPSRSFHERAKASGPIMRSATGFDTDAYRRQLRDEGHQGMACQPLAPQNLAGGVSPHKVKDFFGQIDGDKAQFLFHRTRPLRGYLLVSFPDCIVAYQSRSAQGRVHFINALRRHPPHCLLSVDLYSVLVWVLTTNA